MTANKLMTGEQLDELMIVAVRMQRDAEVVRDFPSANFAYAVQVAVLELLGTRAVASALSDENAALKKYICDECYVENTRTGHHTCAGHGMPSTPATDAFQAELQAQGVEMFARSLRGEAEITKACTFKPVQQFEEFAARADECAAQLRQGGAE